MLSVDKSSPSFSQSRVDMEDTPDAVVIRENSGSSNSVDYLPKSQGLVNIVAVVGCSVNWWQGDITTVDLAVISLLGDW